MGIILSNNLGENVISIKRDVVCSNSNIFIPLERHIFPDMSETSNKTTEANVMTRLRRNHTLALTSVGGSNFYHFEVNSSVGRNAERCFLM